MQNIEARKEAMTRGASAAAGSRIEIDLPRAVQKDAIPPRPEAGKLRYQLHRHPGTSYKETTAWMLLKTSRLPIRKSIIYKNIDDNVFLGKTCHKNNHEKVRIIKR